MKHKRNLNTRDVLCFLLSIMGETASVFASSTPSVAPSSLTRPFDSNIKISPTLAFALAFLVLLLMVCLFVYIRRMSPASFENSLGLHFIRHRSVSRGLDPTIIDTFPIFVYSDVKALKIGKPILECAVCLNEFEDDETLRLLPNCCHVFHSECIDAWLAFRTTCPVCRIDLKTKPGNDAVTDHIHVTVEPQETVICRTPVRSRTARSKTPDFRNLISPKSTPRRPTILGMLSRSHSTGHSFIQPGQDCDRFTLRLPEDARKRLVDLSLSRAHNGPFSPESSSTKGYRFEPEESRLRKFRFEPTPPIFSETSSSKKDGGEKQQMNMLKSVKSIKSPLSLFCGTKLDEAGESSVTYLRSST